jgi:hypothetical protein
VSEIARNYIATREARKIAEAAFDEALRKQYGRAATIWNTPEKTDWNAETMTAFNLMHKAIDAAHRARGIANENGGDFALPVEAPSPSCSHGLGLNCKECWGPNNCPGQDQVNRRRMEGG